MLPEKKFSYWNIARYSVNKSIELNYTEYLVLGTHSISLHEKNVIHPYIKKNYFIKMRNA